jgi:hypothetical protein
LANLDRSCVTQYAIDPKVPPHRLLPRDESAHRVYAKSEDIHWVLLAAMKDVFFEPGQTIGSLVQ